MKNKILSALGLFITLYVSISFNLGCAQIGQPTGGVRDSLAPVLVRATPASKTLRFTGNKITLSFDEYVTVLEPQNNVLVSPLQKNNPTISNSLKTVTIKLKDSLLPNTTYSIQFGDAIRDINEANIIKKFTYVFSTGDVIDSLNLSGKVVLAETGQPDSTLTVLLYRNTNDTAVQKLKPDYLAKLNGDGSFIFNNLPQADFKVYALKDGDGSRNYTGKTELFGFLDSTVTVTGRQPELTLHAYAEEKAKDNKVIKVLKPVLEKKLKYSNNISGTLDLLDSFKLSFNNPLKRVDTATLVLTDTNYNRIIGGGPRTDSTAKIISYAVNWQPGSTYRLIITPDAVEDSAGNKPAKADTITFNVKEEADYGRVMLRFKNYEPGKNPVLQLIVSQEIKYTFPLSGAEFSNKLILPGEYEIRILFDGNNDGKWTPGDYKKRLQPEKAVTLPQKLAIRADWDNERDIEL
jgi:hypothetical protein